jgi:aspartate carbamoyltransferase regulatory subunit
MGEKKKNEAWVKTVSKIFIVLACLLFVGLMILSGMGNQWITMFNSVKSGDTVVLDVTVYDAAGKPIITSEQTVYNQAVAKGQDIFATKQLTVISNKTMEKSIFGVPGSASTGTGVQQLAIFSSEYNAISSGIAGMKVNEKKRISIPSDNMMKNDLSVEQLALSKINLTDISVGDSFFMGVSDTTQQVTNTTKPTTYLRVGDVVSKSPDGVVVDLNYPAIEVRVVSINKQ